MPKFLEQLAAIRHSGTEEATGGQDDPGRQGRSVADPGGEPGHQGAGAQRDEHHQGVGQGGRGVGRVERLPDRW